MADGLSDFSRVMSDHPEEKVRECANEFHQVGQKVINKG